MIGFPRGGFTVDGKVFPLRQIRKLRSEFSNRLICVPESVEILCPYAFYHCENLEFVTFDESSRLRHICDDAFCGCSSLKTIWLPASIEKVEDFCFGFCVTRTSITFAFGVADVSQLLFIAVHLYPKIN
jgi:hypothetical protein